MADTETPIERRKGATGVWIFVKETDDGRIMAMSEWGTVHFFTANLWYKLPAIPSPL